MKHLSDVVKVPFWWRLVASAFHEKVCDLHSLTVHFNSRDILLRRRNELPEAFDYDVCH